MPIAVIIQPTEVIIAPRVVADLVAVTNIEALVGAVAPDRVLYEAGKGRRKVGIISASVDVRCRKLENVGAAAWSITAEAVRMLGGETMQNASAVQKVVHQRINHNEAGADGHPLALAAAGANQ